MPIALGTPLPRCPDNLNTHVQVDAAYEDLAYKRRRLIQIPIHSVYNVRSIIK